MKRRAFLKDLTKFGFAAGVLGIFGKQLNEQTIEHSKIYLPEIQPFYSAEEIGKGITDFINKSREHPKFAIQKIVIEAGKMTEAEVIRRIGD